MKEDQQESIAVITEKLEVESADVIESKKASLIDLFSHMFIKENFDVNTYLQGHVVPASQTVPMSAIFQCPEILEISTDEKTIRHALLESKGIIITEDGIKPLVKPEQNTIILRDISSKTPSEEIWKIFAPAEVSDSVDSTLDSCPPAQSLRSDMNDTWFVTFESEVAARAALQAIKNKKFDGKIIKARLKTETLNKSYFSAKSSTQGGYQNQNQNQGLGSHQNSGRTGSYNGGNDFSGFNNGRGQGRPGGGIDRGQKEYYTGPSPPEYMAPSLGGIPSMPGMFFGSYPVPPPPPYMGMGMNPMNLPNMQMISSYPIVMNTQTGQMQWAGPHPPGHPLGPGPGQMLNPNMHPGMSHSQGGTPPHFNRPKTRSAPNTPREPYPQNGPFKNRQARGMSFGGPGQGPGPGVGADYFHQGYMPNDNMNANYNYQNSNNYNNGFAYQGGQPRIGGRSGNSKHQNQFGNNSQTHTQGPSQSNFQNQNQNQNQPHRRHGSQGSHYVSTGDERTGHAAQRRHSEQSLPRGGEPGTLDPSHGIDPKSPTESTPLTDPESGTPSARDCVTDTHTAASPSVKAGSSAEGLGEGVKQNGKKSVRLQVAHTPSAQSSTDRDGIEGAGSIDLGPKRDDSPKKSFQRGKKGGDDKDGNEREGDKERPPKDSRERVARDRGEGRERGEGRDRGEGRERGEGRDGREKGTGRTRDRAPVSVPKVAQPDFNMDSDFPNLVEGDATEGSTAVSTVVVGNSVGYAAAAKRGVQDSDVEPTPSPLIKASSFDNKSNAAGNGSGNGGRKGIKKSPSSESHTRTVAASIAASVPGPADGTGVETSARGGDTADPPASTAEKASVAAASTQSKTPSVEVSSEEIIFGQFKASVALENVRSLHFGPALSAPSVSPPLATPTVCPSPAPIKASDAAPTHTTATVAAAEPNTDTTSSDNTNSKAAAPTVPATGTSNPESQAPQGAPLSPSSGASVGGVWGAKRSFLDVVRMAK